MLRGLINNKIKTRLCHTHSKNNYCKFNDKIINDKIINIENHIGRIVSLENEIIYIKDLSTYMYLFNCFIIPIILFIK
jgi:hypothetical protein